MTLEQRILDEVAAGREELVELTSTLIGFDTTAREPDDPARAEADLQAYLGERLSRAGAAVDIWEPAAADVAGTRQIPPGLAFDGRPQLAARYAGTGGGPSLLLNGHIDVVPSDPRERWTSDPNRAEIRDGNLYGRGACDMKGGVACMVYATEVLSRLGVRLAGDVIVNTVTDEESSGAGGLATARHGVRADAGVVPEPTAFEVWVACRGSLTPTITVEGRPGHAEMAQPHWQAGGAVNAIEKMSVVLDAVRRLREEWDGRPDKQHPHLSSGTIVPVKISGGEWAVTYPASCSLTCEVMYLPGNADGDGWGREVEAEIEAWIATAAAADPWLALHPPVIELGARHPAGRGRCGPSDRRGGGQGQRRRRRASLAGRPRLVVRRRHLHPLRRHALDRLRPAVAGVGPHDRRARACRRSGLVHAGAGPGGRRLLRGGRMTAAPRLATSDDVEVITRLLKAFFSHEGREVRHLRQNVEAILDDPGRGFFTLAGESAVATTTIRISAGGGASAEIEEIWVQPSARGRGIGSRLLRSAVAECRRRGIQSIELRVTPDDHEVGIPDFYLKQGFRDRGRQIMEFAGE